MVPSKTSRWESGRTTTGCSRQWSAPIRQDAKCFATIHVRSSRVTLPWNVAPVHRIWHARHAALLAATARVRSSMAMLSLSAAPVKFKWHAILARWDGLPPPPPPPLPPPSPPPPLPAQVLTREEHPVSTRPGSRPMCPTRHVMRLAACLPPSIVCTGPT